ncbi:unnamed protein product, partial [Effrenium voratum]
VLPATWKKMRKTGAPWEECVRMECRRCCEERRERWRVIPSGEEGAKLLRQAALSSVRVIVPNNDVRAAINKQRARVYAAEQKMQLLWIFARDTFPAETLASEPHLPGRRLELLQRHDRECGDLAGLVPLAKQMPVVLADHLDRPKHLLRGTVCHISHWVLGKGEGALPSEEPEVMLQEMIDTVFVRFLDADWRIPGLENQGVYPVKPMTSEWHLDQNRKYAKLKISRLQVPLLPAYGCTANASQGGNWDEALADVNVAAGMSRQACYVALSRVRGRKSMRILWSVPAGDEFVQRQSAGPQLLLKQLRGEHIDWADVGRLLAGPTREGKTSFTHSELARGMERLCRDCAPPANCESCFAPLRGDRQKLPSTSSVRCDSCANCFGCFPHLAPAGETVSAAHLCPGCGSEVHCSACKTWRTRADFVARELYKQAGRRVCSKCLKESKQLECARCTLRKPLTAFRICARETPSYLKHRGRRRCDACQLEEQGRERASHCSSVTSGQKKRLTPEAASSGAAGSSPGSPAKKARPGGQSGTRGCGFFFERQAAGTGLCGLHALNNAIGQPLFGPADMEAALDWYMHSTRELEQSWEEHATASGWYSIQVLYTALHTKGMATFHRLQWTLVLKPPCAERHEVEASVAVLQNHHNRHWVVLKAKEHRVYLFDSLCASPKLLADEQVSGLLLRTPATPF